MTLYWTGLRREPSVYQNSKVFSSRKSHNKYQWLSSRKCLWKDPLLTKWFLRSFILTQTKATDNFLKRIAKDLKGILFFRRMGRNKSVCWKWYWRKNRKIWYRQDKNKFKKKNKPNNISLKIKLRNKPTVQSRESKCSKSLNNTNTTIT